MNFNNMTQSSLNVDESAPTPVSRTSINSPLKVSQSQDKFSAESSERLLKDKLLQNSQKLVSIIEELGSPTNEATQEALENLCRSWVDSGFTLIDAVDAEGFSLMHHAVLQQQPNKCKTLIELAQDLSAHSDQEIKAWINKGTWSDKFTPLHFAAFKGNLDAINTLMRYGADQNALNISGLSMMHLAAQGDQPISLYFFKEMGLDLNQQDQKGNTPIHWSLFQASEVALSYMLCWEPNLFLKNEDGDTVTHIAIKAVEEISNVRPLRFLLVRGAPVQEKNLNGETPHDVCETTISNPRLKIQAQKLFVEPKVLECSFLKAPVRKVERSYSYFMFTIFLFVFFQVSLLFVVYPFLSIYVISASIALNVSSFLLLTIVSNKNPGYVKNKNDNFLDLLEVVDNTRLCADCNGIRTIRSRHCAICQKCVERFDHHCPFINNCVGVNNHKTFLAFIISVQMTLASIASLTLYLLIIYNNRSISRQNWADFYISYVPTNKAFLISMGILLLCVSTFFLLAVSLLVYVQISNFCHGKSNSEKFGASGVLYGADHLEAVTAVLFSGIKNDLKHLVSKLMDKDEDNEEFSPTNCNSEENIQILINSLSEQSQMKKFDMGTQKAENKQQSKQSCSSMCFLNEPKSQEQIFQTILEYEGQKQSNLVAQQLSELIVKCKKGEMLGLASSKSSSVSSSIVSCQDQ